MKHIKTYSVLAAIFFAGCMVHAQKFTASVSKNKVSVGEVFQLDFSLSASGKNFSPPSLGDFNIHQGPVQSTSMQIINGSMSQSITLSYYLSAKKEGALTIGAASIVAGNTTLQSNPIVIESVKGSAQPAQSSAGNPAGKTGSQQASGQNLFVRTSVSRSKVYAGEQIQVVHKVYTRLNLKGFQDLKFPSYNGFWTQEVTRTSQYEVTQETIDGAQYSVVEIKRAFLFPQRNGKIEIEPMEAQCVVREKSGKRNDPFEQFFGNDPFFGLNQYKDVVYSVKSNLVTVEVSPLPEVGKPAEFSGAVGDFSVNAVIDKDRVKTNDGINFKVGISGKGNLKLIDAPKINFPDEFESYDPKTGENINVTSSGVSGNKTFEYLLIPRHEGIYKIQAGDFVFFDADKKKYVSLPFKEFTITVEKGEAGSANAPVISSVVKEDVKMVSSDIRYIKTENIDLKKKDEYFFGSPLFIAGYALSPLLFLAFILLRREHIKRNSNMVLVKKRTANKTAQKQLAQAEKSMKANDKETFFVNVLNALYSYAGNKMNIPVSDLSKEKVVAALQEMKVAQGSVDEYVKLMDECEFARYAPGLQSGNLNEVYTRAEGIITKIEDEIA